MADTVFIRIEGEGKGGTLARAVRDLSAIIPNTGVYTLAISGLTKIPLAPFAYWVGEGIRRLFTTLPPFEGGVRTVKQGLATADDFRFVRAMWETPIALPGKAIGVWLPFAKGGSYSPFYADVFLMVNWGKSGAEVRFFGDCSGIKPLSRPQSIGFYFRPGLTWPLRTTSGLALRAMPEGCVFGHKGPAAFIDGDEPHKLLALLALSSSQPFRALVALQLAAAEAAARSYEVGVIQRTVVPTSLDPRLSDLAFAAWVAKRRSDTANMTSHAFVKPALAQPNSTLAEGISTWSSMLDESTAALAAAQSDIDSIAYRLYGVGGNDRCAIERMMADATNLDPEHFDGSNSDIEEDLPNPAACDNLALVSEALDYAVGTAFGRWDIRYATGECAAPELCDPFAPLPVCPPGQMQNEQGLPARQEDLPEHYPLRNIPWNGILVDDPNHPLDIELRVREVIDVIWGERSEPIEHEACEMLGVNSLRDYLRKPTCFFVGHLRRYSKSRRQAPIYWPISSPNNCYTVWLYYHRLSADTLFTVLRDHVQPKLQFEERRAFEVRQESGPSPSASHRRYIAETEELVEDLRALKDELEKVAPLFRPNLNDGVIINCAPLWRMIGLPKWRKDCQAIWNELMKGDYDWAHLALHLWPERVIPKCATDRSLAIAHSLDEIFWQEDPKAPGKWIAVKVPATKLQQLIAERTSPAVKAALESLLATPGGEGNTRKKTKRSRT